MTMETKMESDPYLGRTFDGYRIDELIGKGGMGVVYKATQLSLNRPVAIKLLHDSALEQPQFRARFEREVDVLSKLSHPNIVTVLEQGEIDERPYLVMEYVAGASLRDVLKKGPLPSTEALVIVRSVLSALEHAHDKQIIHRDIKPENILVAPGGIVKVADFGLGRLMGPIDTTRLTHTHLLLGTFEYMSPEQRERSKEADQRTDLYATGVILYELIAGELPIGHFAPLSLKRPKECDNRIDGVIRRSLEKEPDERYQRASEMGFDVSRILSAPLAPELGSRLAPVLAPAPLLQESELDAAAETAVREGSYPESPPAVERTQSSSRFRWPSVLLVLGLLGIAIFMMVLSGGGGPVGFTWPFLAGLAGAAMLLTWFVTRARGKAQPARSDRKVAAPDWHLGLAITALWVAIVLVASNGRWRDEEIMWLCIGAVASVLLIPKLKDFAKVAVWLGVTFGVLLIPVMLFWSVSARSPESSGPVAAAISDPTISSTHVAGRLNEPVPPQQIQKIWTNDAARRWLLDVAFHGDGRRLDRSSVRARGTALELVGPHSFTQLEVEAVAYLFELATGGKVDGHKGKYTEYLRRSNLSAQEIKRMITTKSG